MPSAMGAAETASPAPESCESFSESTVLQAEHFNESSLGRALDDLYTAGTTSVYYHVASQAMQRVAQMNRPFRRSLGREL